MFDLNIINLVKKLIHQLVGKNYVSSYANFAEAIFLAGDNDLHLFITSEIDISTATVVPPNISIEVLGGGSFAISSGIELTINGPFKSVNWQVFSGSGTVVFPAKQVSNPQWWGADAGGILDSTTAFQAAIDCGAMKCKVPNGLWKISTKLTILNKNGFTFEGENMTQTNLAWYGTAGGTLLQMRGSWFSTISNMWLNGNSIGDTSLDLPCYYEISGDTYVPTMNTLKNLRLGDTRLGTGIALTIGDTTGSQLDNLTISKCWIENSGGHVSIKGNVCFHIHFIDNCIFSGYDAIPTTIGINISDRSGLIYFIGAQFVGNGPTLGYFQRADNCGPVTFINCEMESTGPFLKGLDDTGFANTNPIYMLGCTIGYTGNDGTFNTVNGSPTLTKTGLTGVNYYTAGQGITGAGIPANTTVSSVNYAAGTLTISANATATASTVAMTPTFTTTSGSPNIPTPNTAIYTAGQRITGTGIPANTRILSVDAGVKLVLTANATANGTDIPLSIVPFVIDYKQRGAFILEGGGINSSVPADLIFYAPGSVGSVGGLVHETGGKYTNITFKTYGASQLYQTSPIGDFALGGHLSINGATGNAAFSSYTSFGGAIDVTGIVTSAAQLMATHATKSLITGKRLTVATATDEISAIQAQALNSSSALKTFSQLITTVNDGTAGSEDAKLEIRLLRAGTEFPSVIIDNDGTIYNKGKFAGNLQLEATENASAASEPATINSKSFNASTQATTWGRIRSYVNDAAAGTEDADWYLTAIIAGTPRDVLIAGSTGLKSYALAGTGNRLLQADTNGLISTPIAIYTGSATWDPASMADGASASTTITVTGAVAGNVALASLTTIGANAVLITAFVESNDTVRVCLLNRSGGVLDIASGTLNVKVFT